MVFYVSDLPMSELKTRLEKLLKDYKYEYSINVSNSLTIIDIKKELAPNWKQNTIFNVEQGNINHQHKYGDKDIKIFQMRLIEINENLLYFENCGEISVTKLINNHVIYNSYTNADENSDTQKQLAGTKNLEEFFFILEKIIKNDAVKHTSGDFTEEQMDAYYKNLDTVTLDLCLENFQNIQHIDDNLKLDAYDKEQCKISGRSSETEYNKRVSINHPERFINLDCICLNGCEVADLFDINNSAFYHNKKSKDLRVLCLQISIGILLLQNECKKREYFDLLQSKQIDTSKINFTNLTYIAGIILETKKINYKDKISLGYLNIFAKKLSVNLYIDIVKST